MKMKMKPTSTTVSTDRLEGLGPR
jgi:hypothetical protein